MACLLRFINEFYVMGIGRRQQHINKSNRAKKELLGSAPTMAPQEVADGGCVGFGPPTHTQIEEALNGLGICMKGF